MKWRSRLRNRSQEESRNFCGRSNGERKNLDCEVFSLRIFQRFNAWPRLFDEVRLSAYTAARIRAIAQEFSNCRDHHRQDGTVADYRAAGRLVTAHRWALVPGSVCGAAKHECDLSQIRKAVASWSAISPKTLQSRLTHGDQQKLRFPLLRLREINLTLQYWARVRVPDLSARVLRAGLRESAIL